MASLKGALEFAEDAGKKIGREEKNIEVVLRMDAENFSYEDISKITGLNHKEIKDIILTNRKI